MSIKYMHIVDTNPISGDVSKKTLYGPYTSNYWKNATGLSLMLQSISLFPRTARTNVSLRDEKGRFISYKNCQEEIKQVFLNLTPFPVNVVTGV